MKLSTLQVGDRLEVHTAHSVYEMEIASFPTIYVRETIRYPIWTLATYCGMSGYDTGQEQYNISNIDQIKVGCHMFINDGNKEIKTSVVKSITLYKKEIVENVENW